MHARFLERIPNLLRKEEFLKKLRPATRRPVAAHGMTHEESTLECLRGLTFLLFLVLVALVIFVVSK